MTDISLELKGLKDLNKRLGHLTDIVSEGSDTHEPILSDAILQLHRFMSNVVPVDTGRLKNSLHPFVDLSSSAADISTNVEYALPVEFRTGYVQRTVDDELPLVTERMLEATGEAIVGVFGKKKKR